MKKNEEENFNVDNRSFYFHAFRPAHQKTLADAEKSLAAQGGSTIGRDKVWASFMTESLETAIPPATKEKTLSDYIKAGSERKAEFKKKYYKGKQKKKGK